MDVYESLGVRRIINADARLTRLGGSRMPEPVLRAMHEAAGSYVDIFALHASVGRRLADLTRNEAAYVCTGAAAGLFLATLACMVGTDVAASMQLPHGRVLRQEVIIHCAHRIPYDLVVQQTGARVVQIGNALQTFPWELEAALNERTAAVLYIAGAHLSRGALPLAETVQIAHAAGVPVIVDAAAQLPPPENLWRFTHAVGADLAVFSGGKDLCGPQASGMIVGRSELIAACATHGAPHQRLGRPMKVGKEEMIGLLAAVELYLEQDHAARLVDFEATVAAWIAAAQAWPGVSATRAFPNEAGQPTPRVRLQFDPAVCGLTGAEVQQQLWNGEPAIAAALEDAALYLTPDTLEPGEAAMISTRLAQLLA